MKTNQEKTTNKQSMTTSESNKNPISDEEIKSFFSSLKYNKKYEQSRSIKPLAEVQKDYLIFKK